jgi:hypothetical protein
MKNSVYLELAAVVIVILATACGALVYLLHTSALPYTVGSPVLSSSELPKGMALKLYEVPAETAVPTVGFTIARDSMGGWDVHAETTNFTFSPEHLNGAPEPREGHLHLYIDDNLIIMLGPWYHIDSLAPGAHTIRVGLFNNDHSAYAVNGVRIEAEQTLDVPAESAAPMQMN